jgi:tetratricopeptide (TPR) repeat protein
MELIDSIDAEEEKSIQLVVGFFKSLYTIDRTLFNVLIESLPENPTRTDLKILSELIKSDLVFETKETEHYLNLMFAIAKTLGDMAYQADALCLLGNHLMAIRESKAALVNYEAALALFEELNDLDGLARTYHLIGHCQLELDPYFISENLQDFEQYDKNNPISLIEISLLEIVPVDHSWLVSFNKAIQLNELINTSESKKRFVQNLIGKAIGYDQALNESHYSFFYGIEDEDKNEKKSCSEKYVTPLYQEALITTNELDYRAGSCPIYNNLAAIEMDRGDYFKALEYLEKGIPIAESLGDSKRLGYFYWNLAVCKLNLEQIDVLRYFQLRLKASDHLKRSGDLKNEIEHFNNFLRPLRNADILQLNGQNTIDYFNRTFINLIFNLSDRWFNSLTTSSHKSNLSFGDSGMITNMISELVRISWVDLDQIRESLLIRSLITKLTGIFTLIESDRVTKKYEFSHLDPELLDEILQMKIETLHKFEDEEEKTSEDDFELEKRGISMIKQFIEALICDDWEAMENLTVIELSADEKEYNKKLSDKTLEQLSWCRDVNQCKVIMNAYKTNISSYLKELKKDKEKSQYYQFIPEAILILEKIILGKKITDKEISECVSHFKLNYADESPFVFFYRLVLYLKEQGKTELIKEIFLKMDEDDLRFPEVWPRTAEMERIREEVFRG